MLTDDESSVILNCGRTVTYDAYLISVRSDTIELVATFYPPPGLHTDDALVRHDTVAPFTVTGRAVRWTWTATVGVVGATTNGDNAPAARVATVEVKPTGPETIEPFVLELQEPTVVPGCDPAGDGSEPVGATHDTRGDDETANQFTAVEPQWARDPRIRVMGRTSMIRRRVRGRATWPGTSPVGVLFP